MSVELIFKGDTGSEAALELFNFMSVFQANANVDRIVEGLQQAQDKPQDVDLKSDASTSTGQVAKEETVTARRAKRNNGKVTEAATSEVKPEDVKEEKKLEVADAPKVIEFTAPAGFNEAISNTDAASTEVQEAALQKVKDFEPQGEEKASLNYCRALLLYMAATKGMNANMKMLASFNVKKVQEIDADRLPDFAAKMKEELGL